MKRIALAVSAVLVAFVLAWGARADDGPRPRIVFSGGNEVGEVWANVKLTVQRLDEAYLPMVVMVANRSENAARVNRDSLRLVAANGVRYPMPALKELRKGYDKIHLDRRAVSAAGLPYQVWQRDRRLIESNFFPDTLSFRRALVIEELVLPSGFAFVDLVYFAKPPAAAPGRPLVLEVVADGWDRPLRLGIELG